MEAFTDDLLAKKIGNFIKHHRLQENKTQEAVANAAGISRSTLSLLEKGETVTVSTLLQVLRVLRQLHVLQVFDVEETFSPLALAKLEKEKRQRASGK